MLREAHGDHERLSPDPARVEPQPTTQTQILQPAPEQPSQADQDTDADVPQAAPTAADPEAVRVRVLGQPAILDRDGNPAPKLRAKSLELLVHLAVYRNGAPLNQIMEAIWPDATMRRAAERLSTCVGNLRGVIRTIACADIKDAEGTSDVDTDTDHPKRKLEPVINSGGHYRLDSAIVSVDWWTVLDEYAQVAVASDDQHQRKYLQTAIAAIGGPLASGSKYEWIDTDREHVRRHQVKLYAQAAALLADDDPHECRTLLDTACTIDPLSEELARRAMRAAAAVRAHGERLSCLIITTEGVSPDRMDAVWAGSAC